MPPTATELAIERTPIFAVRGDLAPVSRRMIHVSRVHELVDHQIIQHFGRLEEAADVETDHATRRTRAPARTLTPQLKTTETETAARSQIAQSRLDGDLRMLEQPCDQGALDGRSLELGMTAALMTAALMTAAPTTNDRQQTLT